MYNVILVDDDLWIMEEIRAMMEQADPAYHVIQIAPSGRAALEGGRLGEADIVITDINMPEMDGLELIRRIRSAGYGMPIIILSNYNDFARVREALRLGASDYLLKQEITAETFRNMRNAPFLTRDGAAPEEESRKQWLQILQGRLPGDQAQGLINQYVGSYCVMLMQGHAGPLPGLEDAFTPDHNESWQTIKTSVYLPVDDMRAVLIVFSGEKSLLSVANAAWKMAQAASARLQDGLVVISKPENMLERLSSCYEEAVRGLENFFYIPRGRVLDLSTARPFCTEPARKEMRALTQAVLDAIEQKNQEAFRQGFDTLMKAVREKKYEPASVRELMNGLMLSGSYLVKKGGGNAPDAHQEVAFARLEDYTHWADSMAGELEGLENLRKYGSIYKAIQFIEASYGQPITLNDAADLCGFSRNYFSNLFTATFGQSFVQYLLGVRMQKAAALLRDTDRSISAVAEAVGMEYQQFCRRFRQFFHTTPTDYRREGAKQP